MNIPIITETRQLVDAIKSSLNRSNDEQKVYDLSKEFSNVVFYLNRRMQRIVAILDSGDRVNALCEIEKDPNINELLSICSFPEMETWREYCVKNKLEVPEQIDPKLGQVIGQTNLPWDIDTKNALYSHYRESIFSNRYVQALNLIKTISRKYPTEKPVQHEVNRLTDLVSDIYSKQLLLATESRDVDLVKKLVLEINEHGFKDLQNGELWRRSLQIAIESDINRISDTYRVIPLNNVKNFVASINRDVKRYGIVLSDQAGIKLQEIRLFIDESEKIKIAKQELVIRNNQVLGVVSEANDIIRSVDCNIENLSEIKNKISILVSDFQSKSINLPKELVEASNKVAQQLDSRISILRRAAQIRRIKIFFSFASILFVLGWLITIEIQASHRYSVLANANSEENISDLEKILPKCETGGLGVFSRNIRIDILKKSKELIKRATDLESKISHDILTLENNLDKPFSISNYVRNATIISQSKDVIPKLTTKGKIDFGVKINLLKSRFIDLITKNAVDVKDGFERGIKSQTRFTVIGGKKSYSEVTNQFAVLVDWYNNYNQVENLAEFILGERIQIFSRDEFNVGEINSKLAVAKTEIKNLEEYIKLIHKITDSESFDDVKNYLKQLSSNSSINEDLRAQANKIDLVKISDITFARTLVGLPILSNDRANKNITEAARIATTNASSSVISALTELNIDPVLNGKYFIYQVEFVKTNRMNERWICNDDIKLDGSVRSLKFWRLSNASNLRTEPLPSEFDLNYVSNSGYISVAAGDDIKTVAVVGKPIERSVIEFLGLETEVKKRDVLYAEKIIYALGSVLHGNELDPWLRVYVFNKLIGLIELEPELFLYINVNNLNRINAKLKSAFGDLNNYPLLVYKIREEAGKELVNRILSSYGKLTPSQDADVRTFIVESIINGGFKIVAVLDPSGFIRNGLNVVDKDLYIFDPYKLIVSKYTANYYNSPFSIIIKIDKNIYEKFKEKFKDNSFPLENYLTTLNN